MGSFTKLITNLTNALAELKTLEKEYGNPKLAAMLKLLDGTTKVRQSNATGPGKVARYGSDSIKKVLDAVAAHVKEKSPSVLAFGKEAKVSPAVAKALVNGNGFDNPRNKTVKNVADYLKVDIALPITVKDIPKDDEETQVHGLEKPTMPKKGRKGKKK